MVDLADVLADLTAESADVDALVADLPAERWADPTPGRRAGRSPTRSPTWPGPTRRACSPSPTRTRSSPGWSSALADPATFVDRGAEEFLDEPPALLARWRAGRAALAEALAGVPDGQKIPWYGTAMSPVSMATARIMETWAHGLDIAEALGRDARADRPAAAHRPPRPPHARPLVHGPRPAAPDRAGPASADRAGRFAVDVRPGRRGRPGRPGRRWTSACWSPSAATGPTWTSSRPGRSADEWLDVAQAFAGPPGAGREPTAVAP